MKKKDIIIISIITLVYAVISFINLGSTKNPQTFWNAKDKDDYAIIKLEETYVTKMKYFTGTETGSYTLYTSSDGENFRFFCTLGQTSLFYWSELDTAWDIQYMKIIAENKNASIGEFAFYNSDNELINISAVNENAKFITDEQDTVPEEISFMNSTYFDEVYHPNFAYRYVNEMEFYDVHPPLGKLIIAFAISLFGMTPFAYRLMGNLAGIIMIPVIYVMAKDMFKERKYAILAAIIMACDNFHFSQTRLPTLDSFLVLFIMLSYMFMFKYVLTDKSTKLKKKLLLLFLSGLFMGMSIATKWTACFSAIGLAIIFFAKFIKENIVESSERTKEELKIRFNDKKWTMESTKIVLSCILFFVIIPIVIYLLCYIPHKGVDSFEEFWNLQESMLNYHMTLNAEHPFTSDWYTWFIMQRPVWYYNGNVEEGMHSTIVGIGNPIIWWTGLLAMIYVLFKGITKFKRDCWVIIVAILVAIFPYLGISRIKFMYYYFPIIPFMMLSIVMLIKDIESKIKFKHICAIFSIIIFAVFIYFYPVVSGMKVPEEYVKSTQWLDTWDY